MDHKQLMKAKEYFEKAKRQRIGMYMSEIRRQFVIKMNSEGAESKHIKAVTFLRHDQTWHYLNRCKPNPVIEKLIIENMDEWIDKGLYPVPVVLRDVENKDKTSFILTEDPSYKPKSPKSKKLDYSNDWDRIIDGL
jgi:hypothetical protein